jgi:hypothetical protein
MLFQKVFAQPGDRLRQARRSKPNHTEPKTIARLPAWYRMSNTADARVILYNPLS